MSEVLSWPLGCRHSQIAAVAAAVVAVVVVIAQLAGRGPSELTSGSAGLALSVFHSAPIFRLKTDYLTGLLCMG